MRLAVVLESDGITILVRSPTEAIAVNIMEMETSRTAIRKNPCIDQRNTFRIAVVYPDPQCIAEWVSSLHHRVHGEMHVTRTPRVNGFMRVRKCNLDSEFCVARHYLFQLFPLKIKILPQHALWSHRRRIGNETRAIDTLTVSMETFSFVWHRVEPILPLDLVRSTPKIRPIRGSQYGLQFLDADHRIGRKIMRLAVVLESDGITILVRSPTEAIAVNIMEVETSRTAIPEKLPHRSAQYIPHRCCPPRSTVYCRMGLQPPPSRPRRNACHPHTEDGCVHTS